MSKKSDLIDDFVDTFSSAIDERSAAIFAGAGLSKATGFVDWKNLLRPIAKELRLKIDKETDLIAIAQYYVNEHSGRNRIDQLILDEFSKRASQNENHRLLAQLPINVYWTTNYDQLIEQSLMENGKTPDVKVSQADLALNKMKRDAVVYKMHGDVSRPSEAVITKEDYENYNKKRPLFSTALQGDLVEKTFLFLGFSFSDPNIDHILARIRVLLDENKREHYCLMRRVQRNDRNYSYAKTKQELQLRDLKRYGIRPILVDDYKEITAVLNRIYLKNRTKHIFISGSAHEYGQYSEKDALKYLHKLSFQLSKKGYSIVSGFGLGVGSAVINGALDHVFSTNYQHVDEYLTLRPFPQVKTGKEDLPALWKKYREEMLSKSGVAIFVFGNKVNQNKKVVNANGMIQEYEIAIKKGAKVIPVGITGYASTEIWNKVWKDKKKHFGNDKTAHGLLKKLNDKKITLNKSIQIILSLLERVKLGD